MVDGVGEFIEKQSGMRGALVGNEVDSDLESESSDTTLSSKEAYSEPLTFNPETFLRVLREECGYTGDDNDYQKEDGTGDDFSTYIQLMDNELAKQDLDENLFEKNEKVNMIKHMITSIEAQQGLSGPASNMIGSLGLKIPTSLD